MKTKRLVVTILLWTLCAFQGCAIKSTRPLVPELLSAGYPVVYINDGAGDESVLNTLHYADGQNKKCHDTLVRVVDLKEKAIPLLIAHLDDMSPTKAKYQQEEDLSVPLGFVCLDILLQLTDSPAIIHDCQEDGMGACVHSSYYFMPGASAKKAAMIKRHWQELYRKGEIKYIHPEWWK